MASLPTFTSFAQSVVRLAADTSAFGFTADGVYVRSTCTSLILTRPNGTALDCGAAVIGTILPFPCTAASTIAGGSIIAFQAQ